MTAQGYCGANYDRFVENTNKSTLHKMKETYWTTKQAVIKKLGKKEDEHVVASDAELDAKLEVFRAIQQSSIGLLRVIEKYQERLCAVSQEENATGRFLKSHCAHDKTRAGKMMAAVGKSLSFSAQQRLALRVPLVRLYQEVETFRYRAISDTLITINRMEGARTEYRGALLWMKKVSEELDPDTYKQLEKFRKVQSQVRKTKQRFDKLKLDVMQKVDLLAASRCNMFSHVLANYQSTLLQFWQKTSRTMSAVAENFKGYQYYEFNMLKELTDTTKKLAEETNSRAAIEGDPEDFSDTEIISDDELIDVSAEEDEEEEMTGRQHNKDFHDHEPDSPDQASDDKVASLCLYCGQQLPPNFAPPHRPRLLSLDDGAEKEEQTSKAEPAAKLQGSEEGDIGPFMDFHDDEAAAKELEEELQKAEKMMESIKTQSMAEQQKKLQGSTDLLTGDLLEEEKDVDTDDLSVLNMILNAQTTAEDEFTHEWQAVFGTSAQTVTPDMVPTEQQLSSHSQAEFMPSSLLDTQMSLLSLDQGKDLSAVGTTVEGAAVSGGVLQQTQSTEQSTAAASSKPIPSKGQKTDMSAWFNLFADLDPLSNPDAVGRETKDVMDSL